MAEFVVAKESEIACGAMAALRAGGKNIVLCRAPDGTFSALEDRCSHAEVKLSGGLFDGAQVTCPAHGARFDAKTGKALCMPAVTGVKSFAVRVVNGEVIVVL